MLGAAVAEFDLRAHADEELALGLDVADLGDVFEDDFTLGEDGSGHAGEGGVFCSGDLDGAEKGIAAAYYKLVHPFSLLGGNEEMGDESGADVRDLNGGGLGATATLWLRRVYLSITRLMHQPP